eukprot:TRINITY_DN8781_c0_g1_i1.p1 TRINITY_DN8781_c0_g1~~TRINITY_DN8781_c0_g1_i1.p1  ORF type:complete len:277 (+),score=57.77 TRINITY_DN8781_c0_g1_i1:360-1190(+)
MYSYDIDLDVGERSTAERRRNDFFDEEPRGAAPTDPASLHGTATQHRFVRTILLFLLAQLLLNVLLNWKGVVFHELLVEQQHLGQAGLVLSFMTLGIMYTIRNHSPWNFIALLFLTVSEAVAVASLVEEKPSLLQTVGALCTSMVLLVCLTGQSKRLLTWKSCFAVSVATMLVFFYLIDFNHLFIEEFEHATVVSQATHLISPHFTWSVLWRFLLSCVVIAYVLYEVVLVLPQRYPPCDYMLAIIDLHLDVVYMTADLIQTVYEMVVKRINIWYIW